MTPLKRTSPGPKIGPTGNTMGGKAKSIGTTGADTTNKSTAGGQFDFLPSPSKKQGEIRSKPGQSAGPRQNYYDFMPKKAGGK